MTTRQQLVVGIFRDHAQAEQALNELLRAGFAHHQIRFAGRGLATGGRFERIKGLVTGEDMSVEGIYNELVALGAPADDARTYQSEFEAGRSIIAILANERMQEAMAIVLRHGGYGAKQGPPPSSIYGTATGTQQPPPQR